MPRGRVETFTEDQKTLIINGYLEGKKLKTLAVETGFSWHAIRHMLLRNNVSLPKSKRPLLTEEGTLFTVAQQQKMKRLYEDGMSLRNLSAQFGSTPNTISDTLKKIGTTIRTLKGWHVSNRKNNMTTQQKRIGRPPGAKTIGKTDYKKPKTFTLSESAIEWIETQSRLNSLNGSAYLEEMIRKVRTLST